MNPVKSALRVAEILDIVSLHPPGLTFSEFLDSSQLPKSSLHELLTTLSAQRLLTYNTITKRYTLGSRLWEWGSTYANRIQIVPVAWPFLESIRNELNETVQLAILDGDAVMYVAKAESAHPLQLASHVGIRLPAYATGIGQAILAVKTSAEVTDLYPNQFTPYTSSTVKTRDALLEKLRTTRHFQYAIDWGEYSPDIRCIAIPILGMNHQVLAGLSVSVPKARFSPTDQEKIARVIRHFGHQLSRECGATDPESWSYSREK